MNTLIALGFVTLLDMTAFEPVDIPVASLVRAQQDVATRDIRVAVQAELEHRAAQYLIDSPANATGVALAGR